MTPNKKKRSLTLEASALGGNDTKIENLWLEVDRDSETTLNEEEISKAIEAYAKSENNTLGYLAASFSPILLLLTSLRYFDELDDKLSDILITSTVIFLGFAGIYFASYRAILLTFRRILFEGYQLRLINGFSFPVFPNGKWRKLNLAALVSMLLGYCTIMALLLWRIWA